MANPALPMNSSVLEYERSSIPLDESLVESNDESSFILELMY